MNNVNAPAQLAEYAADNGIDLAAYHDAVAELKGLRRFMDPEPPFATEVLAQLRFGATITDAVAEAREVALAALDTGTGG